MGNRLRSLRRCWRSLNRGGDNEIKEDVELINVLKEVWEWQTHRI